MEEIRSDREIPHLCLPAIFTYTKRRQMPAGSAGRPVDADAAAASHVIQLVIVSSSRGQFVLGVCLLGCVRTMFGTWKMAKSKIKIQAKTASGSHSFTNHFFHPPGKVAFGLKIALLRFWPENKDTTQTLEHSKNFSRSVYRFSLFDISART